MGRTQTETINIRLTHEEKMMIGKRMLEAVSPSLRQFVLDMCMNGNVIINEDLREVNKELRYQGNNLNQLVRLAHQGKIQLVCLNELLDCYRKILAALSGGVQ